MRLSKITASKQNYPKLQKQTKREGNDGHKVSEFDDHDDDDDENLKINKLKNIPKTKVLPQTWKPYQSVFSNCCDWTTLYWAWKCPLPNRKWIYFVVSPDYNNAASSWIYDAKWQFNLKTSIIYERLFLTPTEKLFSTCEPGLTMTTLSSFHLIFALRIKLFSEAKIQGGPWKSHF